MKSCLFLALALLLLLLVACAGSGESGRNGVPTDQPGAGAVDRQPTAPVPEAATPTIPPLALYMQEEDITVAPLPLRAGFPFTVTAVIHNRSDRLAENVPVLVYLSAVHEQIGYSPFWQVLTVTVPATRPVTAQVPVQSNLAGGEYELWVKVNQLPEAWQANTPLQREADLKDNLVVEDLTVAPFDAYESSLCPERMDVEIRPVDVVAASGQQRVLVRVHNVGNRAVYNLPVVALSEQQGGIAYTPAIAPCGGSAEVSIALERPLSAAEPLTLLVNPPDWEGSLLEDDFENNRVSILAGLASGEQATPASRIDEYDFALGADDVEAPEPWLLLVTVHNLGTRDAAEVPVRVQNQAGRKITDAIPVVQGNGLGVAAVRVGYLWTRGGTVTLTVNPADAKGAYPEANRENNVVTFTLP